MSSPNTTQTTITATSAPASVSSMPTANSVTIASGTATGDIKWKSDNDGDTASVSMMDRAGSATPCSPETCLVTGR